MAGVNPTELKRALPHLREEFENSQRLIARAVERACRAAEESIATRRLLKASADRPRERGSGRGHLECGGA